MIYKLEPFEDFILTSNVKVELGGQSHFYQFVQNLPINLCTKFGEATVSHYWVIKDFMLTSEVKRSNLTSKVKGHFQENLMKNIAEKVW